MNNNCKIGKVTFKNGTTIHVLNSDFKEDALIVKHAKSVARSVDVSGFVVIGWGKDKSYNIALKETKCGD